MHFMHYFLARNVQHCETEEPANDPDWWMTHCCGIAKLSIFCKRVFFKNLHLSIVNRCRLVMKLDKFLCFMFLFAFLALTLHKTRQKHALFGRITNQTFRLIYSKLTCEPKTKDCAGSRSVQHLIATVLFLLLKFPGFHNQSLD